MGNKKKHIDDAQTPTVDEHFDLLFKDDSAIDTDHLDLGIDNLPEWYDEKLFTAGQDYYRRNLLTMGLTSLIGVLAVIVIPSILKVLAWTKQSGTVCTAYKRYLETLLHIYTLYTTDINVENSMWWRSLNTIRWKHSTSSRRSSNSEAGAITHRDMALTQFGFIGYALVRPDRLALTNEPEAVEGLVHFWRVVGYALGISDRMNICRKNAKETRELCSRLLDEVFAKHMKDPPPNFDHMASVLLDGMWSVDTSLDTDAFMYLWFELSGLKYEKPLSTYSWFNVQQRNFILYCMKIPYIGFFVRNGFNLHVQFVYWVARNVPIIAWVRHGKAESTISMYPKLLKT